MLSRHLSVRPAETLQRSQNSAALSGRAGDLFKAPMPPQQEVCGGGRRDPPRPTDVTFAGLSQAQDPAFPSSPRSALGSPHRSPYSQMPGTPRPEYSQQTSDPFRQQSPPYISPQTPGTPRPHPETPFMVTSPALRLESYSQQPPAAAGRRPSPSHQNADPYGSAPGTPRPSVAGFPPSPGSQRTDSCSSGTLRLDQYSQQPSAVCTQKPPGEGFPPQHAGASSSPSASEPLTSAQNQVPEKNWPWTCWASLSSSVVFPLQPSPGQHLLDSFPRNPLSHTQKHAGMFEATGFSGLAGPPTLVPFEHGPVGPGPPHTDKTSSSDVAQMEVASLSGPVSVMPQQGDSEEKLRQVRPEMELHSL